MTIGGSRLALPSPPRKRRGTFANYHECATAGAAGWFTLNAVASNTNRKAVPRR